MSVGKRKHTREKASGKKHMEPQSTLAQPVVSSPDMPTRLRFRKSQLITVGIIFAILGIIALVLTFAVTPANGDFEAETMTLEAL